MINSSFIRFLLVGLANTSVGYCTTLFLHYALNLSPMLANTGGYVIGGMLSYFLNRRYTFASNRRHREALPRFALTVATCFALNLLILEQALAFTPLPIAQLFANIAYTVSFYLASRFIVFRPHAINKHDL